MKQIIKVPVRERLLLNELEPKLKSARNSNDYIMVYFGRSDQFIKIAFCKDQTYCIGYNFYNMEFQVKTNILLKQYPKTVNGVLSNWLFDWVNRLNR